MKPSTFVLSISSILTIALQAKHQTAVKLAQNGKTEKIKVAESFETIITPKAQSQFLALDTDHKPCNGTTIVPAAAECVIDANTFLNVLQLNIRLPKNIDHINFQIDLDLILEHHFTPTFIDSVTFSDTKSPCPSQTTPKKMTYRFVSEVLLDRSENNSCSMVVVYNDRYFTSLIDNKVPTEVDPEQFHNHTDLLPILLFYMREDFYKSLGNETPTILHTSSCKNDTTIQDEALLCTPPQTHFEHSACDITQTTEFISPALPKDRPEQLMRHRRA